MWKSLDKIVWVVTLLGFCMKVRNFYCCSINCLLCFLQMRNDKSSKSCDESTKQKCLMTWWQEVSVYEKRHENRYKNRLENRYRFLPKNFTVENCEIFLPKKSQGKFSYIFTSKIPFAKWQISLHFLNFFQSSKPQKQFLYVIILAINLFGDSKRSS